MKIKPVFLISLIPLLGACSFISTNSSTQAKQKEIGSLIFGSQRSEGSLPFTDAYSTTPDFPPFSLTSENLYSDGSRYAIRFEKKGENISSLSMTFKKGVEISKIRFFTFGEFGAELNVTFSETETEIVKNRAESYSSDVFESVRFLEERDIDYLFLSNLSPLSFQLAKIEFEYFDLSSATHSSASIKEDTSSKTVDSTKSSLFGESSQSDSSSEAPLDIGEENPDWNSLASQNSSWPSSSFEYRLKPLDAEGDAAPIYTLSKRGDDYVKTLVKYLSREKKCFTYNDVCEYYMAFQSLPSNYTLDSSPERGNKEQRRYQVFSRAKHYATDYPSKLGTFNNASSGLYYELDIDLTGSYNKGNGSYSRGAGRVVIIPEGLKEEGYGSEPVCYFTLDHYADFVEYYNFSNAWSAPFKGVYNRSGSYENTPFSQEERKNPLTIAL